MGEVKARSFIHFVVVVLFSPIFFSFPQVLQIRLLKLLLFFYAPLIEEGSTIDSESTRKEEVLRCVLL